MKPSIDLLRPLQFGLLLVFRLASALVTAQRPELLEAQRKGTAIDERDFGIEGPIVG